MKARYSWILNTSLKKKWNNMSYNELHFVTLARSVLLSLDSLLWDAMSWVIFFFKLSKAALSSLCFTLYQQKLHVSVNHSHWLISFAFTGGQQDEGQERTTNLLGTVPSAWLQITQELFWTFLSSLPGFKYFAFISSCLIGFLFSFCHVVMHSLRLIDKLA